MLVWVHDQNYRSRRKFLPSILPIEPRVIKRHANTLGMKRAVQQNVDWRLWREGRPERSWKKHKHTQFGAARHSIRDLEREE